ncbi:unnamed protein product, partial [Mesorhabditis belari]|uniref:Uncharacterized protein n=1 Tax=Mesorhabditis belari TaxID=2138241 RepID=A0AAF3FP50_9BILA
MLLRIFLLVLIICSIFVQCELDWQTETEVSENEVADPVLYHPKMNVYANNLFWENSEEVEPIPMNTKGFLFNNKT